MAESDEPTQRVDPSQAPEPTRVTPDPTARIDHAAGAPTQPAAGWTPPSLGQQGLGQQGPGPQGWQATSGQQPWWQAPQGQSAAGQAPAGQTPAGQPGYGHTIGANPYGQYQPGQPGQYPGYGPAYYQGQYPQQPYGTTGQAYGQQAPGQYPGYAQPRSQYAQQPYAQYGYPQGQFYAGQPWQPPVQPPKRSRAGAIVAVSLAVVLVIVGFAASPLLFQRTSRTGVTPPAAGPVNPGGISPTIEPDAPQDTDPNGGSAPTGGATSGKESAGIVFIEGEVSNGTAAGTGMVLTADGEVLTNYHVVAGSDALRVTIADSGDTFDAKVLGFDQSRDVALLQLKDASGLATIKVDKDPVKVGDLVAAVGNAGGQSELVDAPGKVTALDQSLTVKSDSPWGNQENLSGVIETTAGAVPGHSGGPMFDADDEVIGMTTAGSTEASRSYAVPIAVALEVVSTIEAGHDVGTVRVGPAGYLGVGLDQPTRSGVLVTSVVKDGPAANAGIVKGSTITAVGDNKIGRDTNLASVIRALEPGEQVTVTWFTPAGEQKQAQLTLGASPVN